ncbi:MAG TPA: hypothetical protein VMW86_08185 [Dehalococcoidales bacterium]|nr:hypothetical protein [Dehalococcoidales bacterium]
MPTYDKLGDSLRADRIAASARSIDKVMVDKLTGKHRGQFTILRDNAFCIIEIPLKRVLDKK